MYTGRVVDSDRLLAAEAVPEAEEAAGVERAAAGQSRGVLGGELAEEERLAPVEVGTRDEAREEGLGRLVLALVLRLLRRAHRLPPVRVVVAQHVQHFAALEPDAQLLTRQVRIVVRVVVEVGTQIELQVQHNERQKYDANFMRCYLNDKLEFD